VCSSDLLLLCWHNAPSQLKKPSGHKKIEHKAQGIFKKGKKSKDLSISRGNSFSSLLCFSLREHKLKGVHLEPTLPISPFSETEFYSQNNKGKFINLKRISIFFSFSFLFFSCLVFFLFVV